MRITAFPPDPSTYSSNVFLLRGDWNRLEDVNTLIDTGRDPSLLPRLEAVSGGVGKRLVELVILTHGHYDHSELLPRIYAAFQPYVRAFDPPRVVPSEGLRDGEVLRAGDGRLVVYHVPAHSQDSVCLYCPEARALFAGDTPLLLKGPDGDYEASYIAALDLFTRLEIDTIYFGHGGALKEDCRQRLLASLDLARHAPHAAV